MAARIAGARRAKLLAKLLTRDEFTCKLCGVKVDQDLPRDHPLAPTFDHIIPRSRGGGNEQSNLQIAHRKCNNERGSRPLPEEYSALGIAYSTLSSLRVGLGELAAGLRSLCEAAPSVPQPISVYLAEEEVALSRYSSLEDFLQCNLDASLPLPALDTSLR